jgi:hypothetical protein
MGVDHRRRHVARAEPCLNGTDVIAVFEPMGGECVPSGMAAHRLRQASRSCRLLDGPRQDRCVQVMPPPRSRPRVHAHPCRRQHPRPPPLARRMGVCPLQGLRPIDLSKPSLPVLLVQGAHVCSLGSERSSDKGWQPRHPVLVPLALPHDELIRLEVTVFHPQPETLQQA